MHQYYFIRCNIYFKIYKKHLKLHLNFIIEFNTIIFNLLFPNFEIEQVAYKIHQ